MDEPTLERSRTHRSPRALVRGYSHEFTGVRTEVKCNGQYWHRASYSYPYSLCMTPQHAEHQFSCFVVFRKPARYLVVAYINFTYVRHALATPDAQSIPSRRIGFFHALARLWTNLRYMYYSARIDACVRMPYVRVSVCSSDHHSVRVDEATLTHAFTGVRTKVKRNRDRQYWRRVSTIAVIIIIIILLLLLKLTHIHTAYVDVSKE